MHEDDTWNGSRETVVTDPVEPPEPTSAMSAGGGFVLTPERLASGESDADLRLQKAFFEEVFQNAPEGTVVQNTAGKVLRINREFTRLFGWSEAELLGSRIDERIVPPALERESKELEAAVLQGERVSVDTVRHRRDGLPIDVAILAQPIKIEGVRVGTYISYLEITRRKREEQARQKFVALVENGTDFIAMADLYGNVEYVNSAGLSLLQLTLIEAVTARRLDDIIADCDRDVFHEQVMPALHSRGRWSGELNFRSSSRPRIPMQSSFFQVRRPDSDEPVGIASISKDITELKEVEDELRRTKDVAEEANRSKSQFLANMSHEIRTPLNAIIGMADLLWEAELEEEQAEYVRIFRSAGLTLLELINDILDVSKIEAGEIALEDRSLDLDELVAGLADVFAVQADTKGLELFCHLESDVPGWVRGDAARLRQVLVNLLGNALKFTERGEVALTVRRATDDDTRKLELSEPRPDDEVILHFSIRDTGEGIPRDKLEAVFARFTQADASTTRKHGGTGLGLTICQSLVEMMGGSIWVESEVDEGANFQFMVRLGAAEPEEADQEMTAPIDLRRTSALVVVDGATSRAILKQLLVGWGCEPDECSSGSEALRALEAARERGRPYDLVLLDGRMPHTDGFEVAQQLTADAGLSPATIMLISSLDRGGSIKRVRELGVSGYLVKPVQRAALAEAIQSVRAGSVAAPSAGVAPGAAHAGQGGTTRSQPDSPEAPTAQSEAVPPRILVVEDTADNIKLIQAYLKKTPHQMDFAENGLQAVERYTADPSYDLIFMDMQMPVLDGYGATRQIRQWERDQDIAPASIVALTAHALKEGADKCLEAGCDAHLTKPIRKKTLLAAIEEYGRQGDGA